jgi:hypothetical protein
MISKKYFLNRDFYNEKNQVKDIIVEHISNIKRSNFDETSVYSILQNGDSFTLKISGVKAGGVLCMKINFLNVNNKLVIKLYTFFDRSIIIILTCIIGLIAILLIYKGMPILNSFIAQFPVFLLYILLYLSNIYLFKKDVIDYIDDFLID